MVFLEPPDEGGQVNRGLLAEGRRVAAFLGGQLCALAVGVPFEETAFFEEYAVSMLYAVHGEGLADYSAETFSRAVIVALEEADFGVLLFAHSDRGAEVAPRIAATLNTTAVTDCVAIRLTTERPTYVRHVYGGQFEQEVSYAEGAQEVVTLNTDVLTTQGSPGEKAPGAGLRVVDVPVVISPDVARTTPLRLIPPDSQTIDVLYAKRIVGVGSGCGHLLPLAEELARLLDASIGTTRPVVDDGLIPKTRMIGQTGKAVSPDFYFALGVSGSPHHAAGMQRSKKVLSINRDPRAPIFALSDVGFVGDLDAILPKLVARIKRYRDEGL